ncbi:hypothetical protein ACQBAR_06105 [Propionibacteriaceae bacterium Y1685]
MSDAEEQARIDAAFADLVSRFDDSEATDAVLGRTSTVPGTPGVPNLTREVSEEPTEQTRGWRQHTLPEDDPTEDEAPQIPALPPYRPSPIAVLGLGLLLLAAVLGGLIMVGIRLPSWAGWLGLGSLLGGVAALLSRLPRTRDPEDGDGARL